MTLKIDGRFRRPLMLGAMVPAGAALALGLTAASASAATNAPAHHQRCDQTLTYIQEEHFGGRFIFVRDACNVHVIRFGFGRHGEEDLAYQTERFGFLQDHFVRDVRDVEVFH